MRICRDVGAGFGNVPIVETEPHCQTPGMRKEMWRGKKSQEKKGTAVEDRVER